MDHMLHAWSKGIKNLSHRFNRFTATAVMKFFIQSCASYGTQMRSRAYNALHAWCKMFSDHESVLLLSTVSWHVRPSQRSDKRQHCAVSPER